MGVLLMIIIMSCVILGVFYPGWLLFQEAMEQESYADSFDIRTRCIIIDAEERESKGQSCTVNQDGTEYCVDSTKYYSYYDYIISPDINETMNISSICAVYYNTSDVNETEIYEYTLNGNLEYFIDDEIDCYTNDDCHDVFLEEDNIFHSDAMGYCVAAVAIFLVDFCCICCCVWAIVINFGTKRWPHCKECCECLCDLSRDHRDYDYQREAEVEKYYEYQWNRLSQWKQYDYIIGNWVHNGHIDPRHITDNMYRIIMKYSGVTSNHYEYHAGFQSSNMYAYV